MTATALADADPSAAHKITLPGKEPGQSFWILQIGGWLAFVGALMLPWLGAVPLRLMLARKLPLACIGFLTSAILRQVYRRVLRREPSMPWLITVIVLASYAGGLVWNAVGDRLEPWIGPAALERGALVRASLDRFDASAYYTLVLIAWSLLYMGITHYVRLEEQRARTLRAEALGDRARLQALRYQVSPHFLFNTLNAISTLVVEHRAADANRMIARLSDFLRYTLDGSDSEEIPLSEEIDFVRRYLEIEQVRFGDRLAIDIAVDPATYSAAVPSLILQPLVENAVRHAIARNAAGGRVAVAASRRDDVLQLMVQDDGPGILGSDVSAEGIGLRNTRSRLRHLYGEAYRLDLVPGENRGLTVVVELPWRSSVQANTDGARPLRDVAVTVR
jgi:two-component system, LytTR family, sensor kinase